MSRSAFAFVTLGMVIGAASHYLFCHHLPNLMKFKNFQPVPDEDENDDVPDNAPEHCPGVNSDQAGKSEACAGCPNQSICASGAAKGPDPTISEIQQKLSQIGKKVLILSGKGGVGKSTVSTQVAWSLVRQGFNVGLLDIDICGPSIPRMTGSNEAEVHSSASGWSPVYVEENFAVMSIGFLLPNQDDAIIWRGPKKNGLIRQFLTDVTWGELDFLLIDTPPGTSDEHLSIVTYLAEAGIDGALVVTTPQEVSLQDVRKEITFCKKTNVKVLGVVENMVGSVFAPTTGGAESMATKMEVPMAGSLPLTSELLLASENGKCVLDVDPNCSASLSLSKIVDNLLKNLDVKHKASPQQETATTAPVTSDA